jgi:hypothetical protein
MTHYDVFAGRLRKSNFDWTDKKQELEASDIQCLTGSFLDGAAFSTIHRAINENKLPFRQLDWGSWVVPVTKDQLLALIAHWKEGYDLPDPGDTTHFPRLQRAECKAVIEALPAKGAYVVVLEEF